MEVKLNTTRIEKGEQTARANECKWEDLLKLLGQEPKPYPLSPVPIKILQVYSITRAVHLHSPPSLSFHPLA